MAPVSQSPAGTTTRPPPPAAHSSMARAKAWVQGVVPSPTAPKRGRRTSRMGEDALEVALVVVGHARGVEALLDAAAAGGAVERAERAHVPARAREVVEEVAVDPLLDGLGHRRVVEAQDRDTRGQRLERRARERLLELAVLEAGREDEALGEAEERLLLRLVGVAEEVDALPTRPLAANVREDLLFVVRDRAPLLLQLGQHVGLRRAHDDEVVVGLAEDE